MAMKSLEQLEQKYLQLQEKAESGELLADKDSYANSMKELSQLQSIVPFYQAYKEKQKQLAENKHMLETKGNEELSHALKEEILEFQAELEGLRNVLVQKVMANTNSDENNNSVIMEVRSGTGGDEASLFAADLFRMYSKLSERKGWQQEIISSSPSTIRGYKEVVFAVKGKDVYLTLKYETGAHRVQRIPETESSGRIHTSVATVAVLHEVSQTALEINPKDLKIDTYRAAGAGGQHVNTTDSAIRITHLPSNIVVTCQDERSQLKNKERGMKILRARLYEKQRLDQEAKQASQRREQIGSGDRSQKIRTYNFPQGRVSDHRTHSTLYQLEDFLNGNIDEITLALQTQEKDQQLKTLAL